MHARHIYLLWLIIPALLLVALPVDVGYAAPGVAEPFQDYYTQHQGVRVLGEPLSDLLEVDGLPAQYFEKGRIEDHRSAGIGGEWAFAFGRLTAELIERDPNGAVNNMGLTYAALRQVAEPRYRQPIPAGFSGGTQALRDGQFIPFDAQLRPVPGHVVPWRFWNYITRKDLFPGGWLHDIGLPLTEAITVETYKQGEVREITYQAFERTILTDDRQNPPDWQVERGNIGTDALRTLVPGTSTIEIPTSTARVTIPLHILARVGVPGAQIVATLYWQDGTLLRDTFTVVRGEDRGGLVIGNLDWGAIPQPPAPPTQPATLEIRSQQGDLLARQSIVVLSPADPNTMRVRLYWTVSGTERIDVETRTIPRTPRVATAAIEELLWGPPLKTNIGWRTALPTQDDVLRYLGREPDWGPRVTLSRLALTDGVATVVFSPEMAAYGGGSTRVQMISQQITRTLKQFPTIHEVRIWIEGQTEEGLQP